MRKILLFSRDPGGANSIIPLVEPLVKRKYQILLYGKDIACAKYSAAGLDFQDILHSIKSVEMQEIEKWLSLMRPDLIITGTSADDMTEKYLWKMATLLNIPSFAILDQWINYGIRFSSYYLAELDCYSKDKKHPFLPTKIMVMDEYARKEIVREGISAERILVTGQPYFETLFARKKEYNKQSTIAFKKRLKLEGEFIVVFVSEPISKVYNERDNNSKALGYTEKTIFKTLYKILKLIVVQQNKNITIVIKLHPKEDSDSYDEFLQSGIANLKVVICKEIDPWPLIMSADFICGMSSMLLIEAALLNLPIMSIQIGLKREDPFILGRRGIIKTILNETVLQQELKRSIAFKCTGHYNFEIIKDPINKIIGHVEDILCRN